MPPRTRANKTTKASKENVVATVKSKAKQSSKTTVQRKALSDKTNSASDENPSPRINKNTARDIVKSKVVENVTEKERPRRERKVPSRFNENNLLVELCKKNDEKQNTSTPTQAVENKKDASVSPFVTPEKVVDNSLVANRPRRICRLPSKFDDHSISPNKFIPVGFTSTPIVHNKNKNVNTKLPNDIIKSTSKNIEKAAVLKQTKLPFRNSPTKKSISNSIVKVDLNISNDAKKRLLRERKLVQKPVYSTDKPTVSIEKEVPTKIVKKNSSIRILEENKKSTKRDCSHLDIYEFTFDPNDEPPPQKKKRKRVVKKKSSKPRTVILKANYNDNMSKAMASLKSAVAKKPVESHITKQIIDKHSEVNKNTTSIDTTKQVVACNNKVQETQSKLGLTNNFKLPFNTGHMVPHQQQNVSTRVEDIAADFEPLMDHNDIDYSPVTTPHRDKSPLPSRDTFAPPLPSNDPLNLREDFSFFDDPPVACSSMNKSVRRPDASPWRVQFDRLPIKWQANTYVKPNMTPAVESSFINNYDENRNKKKHVYTNLIAEACDALPEIASNNQPNLKQTSIISFIKEVVEKSASKKKRAKSLTPVKANSVFENVSNLSDKVSMVVAENTPEKDLSNENSNNKDKTSNKNRKKNTDGTFFGFDESEDQENVSPVKKIDAKVRALRPRARAVLQEINTQTGPSRAKLPLASKTNIAAKTNIVASSDAVNKAYDQLKDAEEASVFPEINVINDENIKAFTNVENQPFEDLNDDDSQSVHLFEDIELIHHLKPTRKSYGKAKKVALQQTSDSDNESQDNEQQKHHQEMDLSDYDDLADLSFTVPNVDQKNKPKKKAKNKKQLSKKEKAEMDAWAAQFNSMCEDIEHFPLVVE